MAGDVAVFGAVIAVAVAALLVGEKTGKRWLVFIAKPVASLAFVLLGWRLCPPGSPYGAWVVLALVLSLAGDVALMLEGGFVAGLASFLLAHIAYIAAFQTVAPAASWRLSLAAPVVTVSAIAAAWLWPYLGRKRWVVLAYVAVITVMVWGGVSIGFSPGGWWVRGVGAVLFYVSDLFVARNRFVAKGFINRAWGLPLYYLGQVLLAVSVAG